MKEYLEAGRIVNTHGIKGEVKIQSWANSPEFLLGFSHIYIDGRPVKILSSRVHKSFLIAKLESADHINAAIKLKNKVIFIKRSDAKLESGEFFLQDIIGLPVITEDGTALGILKDVLSMPAQRIFVVQGDREHLIPDVPEFILEKNLEEGFIKAALIEGM